MDEKDLKKLIDDSGAKLDQLNTLLEKKADASAIEAKHKEIMASMEKIAKENGEAAKKMQDQLDAMDKKMQTALMNDSKAQKSLADQLKDAFTSDDYKRVAKIKNTGHDFEIKANELTTAQFTETNGPVIQRLYEPGVISAPQRPTPIWDLVSKGVTTSDYVIQTERSSQTIGPTGAHVDEAHTFAQSYGGWTTYVWGVNKVGEYIKVAREKLEDWEYVRGEVMDMLTTNIPHIRESMFLTKYNATQVWLGLINTTAQVAKDFAKPTGLAAVPHANYFDVLRAAILQCQLGNSANLANKMGYNPNAIVLNPVDVTNLAFTKDENGQYVRPVWANGELSVDGVRIVPTIYMTAGKFLVGDFSQAKAWVSRSLNINMWDQNDTDAIFDLVTFTASHRLAFGVGATRAYAFVYGDFNSGLGLISA